MIKCGDGKFCWVGSIEPFECTAFNLCDGKSMNPGAGSLILIILLIIMCCSICVCSKRRDAKMLKQSEQAFDQYASAELGDFGKNFKNEVSPVSIEFEDLGLTLKAKRNTPPIISGVTGHFPPSSMVALMGPSGCGKTTFMNTIIDRAAYGKVSGSVKVNGVPGGFAKTNMVGFVPQDDIVHGNLTVFQNMWYSAVLRLPRTATKAQITEHVQGCINVLGLQKVQNVLVGTPEKRGISGGQKKRVNIGLELAAMPSVIFMDEPTSGLDGAATVSLARCLALLKDSGLTIICVIHQPRATVFKLFTHLLLLGEGGKQVYCGRTEFLVSYFTELGFRMPSAENPADWMIDVCSNLEPRYQPGTDTVDETFVCPESLVQEWLTHGKHALVPGSKYHEGDPPMGHGNALGVRKVASLCTSFKYVIGRTFRQTDVTRELTQVSVFLCLGLLGSLGMVLGDWSWNIHQSIIMGGSVATLFNIVLGMQHRFDFGDEKLILSREVNSGIYVFALWVGKTLKAILFAFFKIFALVVVLYSLATPMQPFGSFLWAWLLSGLWWVAFAQMISLGIQNQTTAVLVLLFVPIFAGIYTGMACYETFESMCPRMGFPYNGFNYFIPDYPRWMMLWATELGEFPEYVSNFTAVNLTNYLYFEEKFYTSTVDNVQTTCQLNYKAFAAHFNDEDREIMYGFAMGMLILW
eukprot:CAMPEP_0119305436 /NCGR_PEP_ID=MMETSP1333-20130426/6447_1 /TAXON_ID=418940 /ORGANISM="Scyphosphaera apsteinii, Strain RCC1455" /LENGTH=691 /DNA_ID=CAMNT_0007308527 /DNA_START=92 /DNA_END=2164 /DNA_ORIENTATION=-